MIIPDLYQQHGSGDHLTSITHQVLQQPELTGFNVNVLARAFYGSSQQIHFQIGYPKHGFGFRRLTVPANQRLNSGEKFSKRKRFGQVIITAAPQAFNAIINIAQGTQYKYRHLISRSADRLDDREPVHAREHTVDNHDVVLFTGGHHHAVFAVGSMIDYEV